MKRMIFVIFLMVILSTTIIAAADIQLISLDLVNQDPDPVSAGDIVEVRIGVQNLGGESVNDLIIDLDQEYPFTLVSGEQKQKTISTLSGYQSDDNMQIIKYKLLVDKDASEGTYDLNILYSKEGSVGTVQKSVSIDVENEQNAEIIHIDRTDLIPGIQSPLKFTVTNVGNAPLKNLRFNWVNEENVILPVGSDNTRYLSFLDVGESKIFEYNVIADSDVDAGLYKLDLQLTYDSDASERQISTIAGIYVGGATDFDLAYSESTGTETSFTVANVGSNPAYSVSVGLPSQQGVRVTGTNEQIIGNLDKGDYTVASFEASIVASSVNLEIEYTDTAGKRLTVEKTVYLNRVGNQTMPSGTSGTNGVSGMGRTGYGYRSSVVQQESFVSKYKWYMIVLVLLVVLCFGYRRIRHNKLYAKRSSRRK